mmetsp:Transcript_18986/g.44258  ORF Transcript_18986/g.44258 Transcript_18986/m.44258 type:complete len:160 (-) Transcript_18986:170-649(-)
MTMAWWFAVFISLLFPGAKGSLDLLEHHMERLADDDKWTVRSALENIRDLGEHVDEDAWHIVDAVMKMLEHEDKWVVEDALEALAHMPEYAAKYMEEIKKLSWSHENKWVRRRAYETLTELVPHKRKYEEGYKPEPGSGGRKRRKRKGRKIKVTDEEDL